MDDKKIVSARVNNDVYLRAKEDAAERDMSLSEWIEDRITDDTDNSPTAEEILNMDWEEKVNVIDEYGLDNIDPDAYDGNEDEFAEGIIDELGLEFPLDDNNPNSFLWLFVPIAALLIWLLSTLPKRQVE